MSASTSAKNFGLHAIAAGIFAKPELLVVEAYSEYDQEPLVFTSPSELTAYIQIKTSLPKGVADVCVVYPDMGGCPFLKAIHLDSNQLLGKKVRYTW